MAIRTRTLAELNRDAFDFVLRNSDGKITLLAPGSVARALIESANRHLEGGYESLAVNHAMAYLSQATGVYLDLHGSLFGMQRRAAMAARVLREDNAIRFYVATGTLIERLPKPGDLNRGIIPAGTTVTSADGSVIYTVEEDVTFERTAVEVFVPARAAVLGGGANVGAHVLRKHNLPSADVQVTNPISITSGSLTESDESFRARISNAVLTAQRANETAVRLAALSGPGVADVRIVPLRYGAGSFKVVVIPAGNRVPTETLQFVQRNIAATVALGIYYRVEEPFYKRVSIVLSLQFQRGVLVGERDAIRTNVERAILDYIGGIQIGGELVVTGLGAAIRQSDERVYDYRVEALCVNGRHQLLHNIRLRPDELFLPDTGLLDPIKVI